MGTLYNQSVRKYNEVQYKDIVNEIDNIKELSKQCKISFDQALKMTEILENKRRNDLFVANGDAWDEQICGIGECIDRLSFAIETIGSKIEDYLDTK